MNRAGILRGLKANLISLGSQRGGGTVRQRQGLIGESSVGPVQVFKQGSYVLRIISAGQLGSGVEDWVVGSGDGRGSQNARAAQTRRSGCGIGKVGCYLDVGSKGKCEVGDNFPRFLAGKSPEIYWKFFYLIKLYFKMKISTQLSRSLMENCIWMTQKIVDR